MKEHDESHLAESDPVDDATTVTIAKTRAVDVKVSLVAAARNVICIEAIRVDSHPSEDDRRDG